MKSLGDDSLPIDVTRDERIDSNRVVASLDNNALPPQHFEDSISPEHITQNYMEYITDNTGLEKYPVQVGFLVSFLVDARGGAMRGCRHSGVRVIVPPRCAPSPTRITCRYVRPQRTPHPPPLMEGEALASRVLELGPTGVKFLGPVIIEVPHFAALRNKEREIVILRSDNGESWKEHSVEATEDILHEVLRNNFEADDLNELEDTSLGRITRIVTQDFPQYFAVVSRVRQEVHAIGPEGGMVSSTVVPQVQAVFPEGALTKKIKVGLQAQPIDPELSAKLLGHGVAVSPVVTVEPRRRKFHKAITLTMPAPKAHSQGMINQYSGSAPTLRLLCSITGGTTRAQWEDVTGSTPLTFVNDCVSFTTTVSARFWLMDCRNISDATKMATELYKEAIHVPFMAKFVVFAKRVDPLEARLRVFCMTDDKEDKTLEHQEQFTEVAKSRDVEVLEGKQHYIEFAGNLVPITKSGEQLSFCFRAFKENRLPFSVRIKDQHAEAVSRCLFMKEPKVPKGEPPQQPICILNIVLPDDIVSDTVSLVDSDSYKKHSNISENYYYYRQDPRMADMSNLLGEDWISLANQLGLTATEMNVIKSEYPDSTAKQAQSMLRMWLSQSSKKDQMNILENALWRIGRGDIVSQCLNDEGLEIIPRAKKEISPSYRPRKEDYERDNNETKVPTKATLEDQEGKRNNIRDKYLAEEKEQWEEEEEEEPFDKPVAERRKKIQKRLSAERTIPASSQRREIVQEITTIKQQSLVEDKLAEVQQKVIEHEEKSKTALSKTTTTKTDQFVISNNKESTSLGDERTISSENAHKTTQDKVLMEGITERLKKETVTKHISVEDGQKSPKFSKTPPPSPADFLLRETYTSEETELAGKAQIKTEKVVTDDLTSKHRSGRESYHSSFLVSPLSYFVSENQQTIVRNPFTKKNDKNFETTEDSGTIPKTTCTKQFSEIFDSNNDDGMDQINLLTAIETADKEQNVALSNPLDNDDFILFNNDWIPDEKCIKNIEHLESNNNPFQPEAHLIDVVDIKSINDTEVENENCLYSINPAKDAVKINENYLLGFDKMEDFNSTHNYADRNPFSVDEKKSVFSIKEFAVEQTLPIEDTSIETTSNTKIVVACQNETNGKNQFTSDLQINPSEDALINIPVKKKLKVPKQLYVSQQGNITDIQLNMVAKEKFLIDFEDMEDVKDNNCKASEDLMLLTPENNTTFHDTNKTFNDTIVQPEALCVEVEIEPKDLSPNPRIISYERPEESALFENNKLDTIYESDSCDTTSLACTPTTHNDNLTLSQDPIFYTETIKKILPGVELESPTLVVNVIKNNVFDIKSPDSKNFKEENYTIEEKLKSIQSTEEDIEIPIDDNFWLLENSKDETFFSTVPSHVIPETVAQTEENILSTHQSLLSEISSNENAFMTEFGVKSDDTIISSEPLLIFDENTDEILQSGDSIMAKELLSRESNNKLESLNNENLASISNQSSKELFESFNVNLQHHGDEESLYDGLKSEMKSNKISVIPQYVSYFKHKEEMREPCETNDDTKNIPIISTIAKHELNGKSNIISLDHFKHANTSTLNLSPSTNVLIEVPVKRKLKIPKRTKLNVEDTPLGENFESGGILCPDSSLADKFKDRCKSSLHFVLETPIIAENTEQNITPECRSLLSLNPSPDVLIEVPVKRKLLRPKQYTNYSELITCNEKIVPEKQTVKSCENDDPSLSQNVDVVHSCNEDNNVEKVLHTSPQSIWWEGAFRNIEIAKEDGLAEQCEVIRQTEVTEYSKLPNLENLLNFNQEQPKKNPKASVQLLIKHANRNDPIEIQPVKNFLKKRSKSSKTNKKCFTLPHRSALSEPFAKPTSNSKSRRSLSVPDLLLTSDSEEDSEEGFGNGNIYTLPTIFSKYNKGSNRLLSVQKAKYPLQCTNKSPLQRRKKPIPKVPEQSKVDSSTPLGEHSLPPLTTSPVFHSLSENHPHPDGYCDWISQKSDILNDDNVQEVSASKGDQPAPSMKAEGEEGCAETEESKPSH